MKHSIFFITAIFILESCTESKQENKEAIKQVKPIALDTSNQSRDSKHFLEFTKTYRINDINIYKNINDSLKHYDLAFLSSDSNTSSDFEKSVYIIFLREYIHHLEIGNIGFDLKTMCLGDSKFLFNYFTNNAGVDSTIEFMQSGYAVEVIKSKRKYLLKDNAIDSLYKKAQKLESEINKEHRR